MDYRTTIQEMIRELTSRMDIIADQLRILFESIEQFKHKRHLIIYSYLLGYYASKGNDKFNRDILLNSLEVFDKSLTRKTELSNLIIAISLSINQYNEIENKNQEEDNAPKINITETMLSNDPYVVYQDLFGETVTEKPLIETNKNIQKINPINKIQNNFDNNYNEINKIHKNNTEINKKKFKNDIINNLEGKNNMNNNRIIPKKKKEIIINPSNNIKFTNKSEYNLNTINASSEFNIHKKLEGTEVQKVKLKKIVKCCMCSENFNELDKQYYKLNCKCVIHKKCFIDYIIKSIKSHNIPILCPKCHLEINEDYIYKSLNSFGNKDLIKEYENYCLELYIKNCEQNNDIVYYRCPTKGCKNDIPCKINENKLVCPLCRKEYCIRCYRPWHNNKNCEDYYLQNYYNQIEEQFSTIKENKDKYRQCPKCQSLMVKEEGTNKILCVCGTTFCYQCGKSIKEKHDCQ